MVRYTTDKTALTALTPLTLVVLMLLFGCGDNDSTDPDAGTQLDQGTAIEDSAGGYCSDCYDMLP
jgi:hypothetical protein